MAGGHRRTGQESERIMLVPKYGDCGWISEGTGDSVGETKLTELDMAQHNESQGELDRNSKVNPEQHTYTLKRIASTNKEKKAYQQLAKLQ